jgi:hypothetical protein
MDRFMLLEQDSGLAPIRDESAFRELVREWAGRWIERVRLEGAATQADLRMLGLAHVKRGELALAEAAYERSVAAGGPLDDAVRAELAAVQRLRAQGQGP